MTMAAANRTPFWMASAAALAVLVAGPASAQERTIFDDVKLEAIPETNGADPYPNEMVLLRIRGVYRPLVNIAIMQQPSLTGFGWTNLMRDVSFPAELNGFPATGFERTIAIFPEKTGDLTIESFTHKLTVVDGVGSRLLEVKSPPITLKVATWKGDGGPNDRAQWWLPSSEVKVTDSWSGDPNNVPRGKTVRRTVTIEAKGVMAEQMPPPPVMRSAGVISFRGPIDRETVATPEGPVSRATYRWDMRPTSQYPAIVDPIPIPWFDTTARKMRAATIPAQRMAWAALDAPQQANGEGDRPSPLIVAGAGGLAFLIGLGVMLAGAGAGRPLSFPPRALYAMRLAAWRRDPAALRAAVSRLARDEPERAKIWSRDPKVVGGLAELDRHLFEATAGPVPNLRRLARTIAAARRSTEAASRPAVSALAPLDGPARRG